MTVRDFFDHEESLLLINTSDVNVEINKFEIFDWAFGPDALMKHNHAGYYMMGYNRRPDSQTLLMKLSFPYGTIVVGGEVEL